MKIGIIGIGDIAQKAYLPLLQNEQGIELHLFTPNKNKLLQAGNKYRITNLHDTLDSLIASEIKGAFVHAATAAHLHIIDKLLQHNIHVYVDKPITYDFKSTKALHEAASQKKLILMTGFNRRYAPSYQFLKDLVDINMVIMQKNRENLPGDIRNFIFDDFIHVVDTLRFIFPHPLNNLVVKGKKKNGQLYQVVIQMFSKNGAIALGIMNRDSGVTEEKVEVFSPSEKRSVLNISEVFIQKGKDEKRIGGSDWEPTLRKRGFSQIISHFLDSVENNKVLEIAAVDALISHEICEKIVNALEAENQDFI